MYNVLLTVWASQSVVFTQFNMVITVLLPKYPKDVDTREPQVDSSVGEQKDTMWRSFFPLSLFNSIQYLVTCIIHFQPNTF